jgi:hypothetical protein
MDITLRVKSVRPFAVECMVTMLLDGGKLILGHARDTVAEVMMAAAWICGEYSEVLTNIMLDLKTEEESGDEDEDEEDQGYWIEGPEGDEIRSKWRGKPVVVMTIACLLQPRSTNLPARVQSAFIHAAMKILIRSCDGRCGQDHLSQILALLRTRLPVYLQSVHLEVQERASTLRYLLAETGILAVDAGLDYGDEAKSEGDLLTFKDLEPGDGEETELTQTRVLSVDIAGASCAIRANAYLSAIVCEEFYGVHPKAQRKVQVPDGLDLTAPFNKKAVDDLLSEDSAQPDLNLSTLSFTRSPLPSVAISSDTSKLSFGSDRQRAGDESYPRSEPTPPPASTASHRSYDGDRDRQSTGLGATDQTFYLSRTNADEGKDDSESGQFADGLQPIDTLTHTEVRRKKKPKRSDKRSGRLPLFSPSHLLSQGRRGVALSMWTSPKLAMTMKTHWERRGGQRPEGLATMIMRSLLRLLTPLTMTRTSRTLTSPNLCDQRNLSPYCAIETQLQRQPTQAKLGRKPLL